MSRWRIKPREVVTLLEKVEVERTGLASALEREDMEVLSSGMSASGDIHGVAGQAVAGLVECQSANLKLITSSVSAGIAGVFYGARAYARGSEAMRVNIHNEMVKSAQTGNFSFFENLKVQGF